MKSTYGNCAYCGAYKKVLYFGNGGGQNYCSVKHKVKAMIHAYQSGDLMFGNYTRKNMETYLSHSWWKDWQWETE